MWAASPIYRNISRDTQTENYQTKGQGDKPRAEGFNCRGSEKTSDISAARGPDRDSNSWAEGARRKTAKRKENENAALVDTFALLRAASPNP
mgnify:CR=1 FL=1